MTAVWAHCELLLIRSEQDDCRVCSPALSEDSIIAWPVDNVFFFVCSSWAFPGHLNTV